MQQTELVDTKKSEAAKSESNVPLQHQLTEAEGLTNDLKRLLVRYESALEQEGIRDQVETLERWMESYRRGLSAAR